jgi:hypothetical protein
LGRKGRGSAVKSIGDCVSLFEKQLIKSLIHPPKWRGFGGIKKTADTGKSPSGWSAEVTAE